MTIPAVDFSFWATQCCAMALAALLIPNLRVTSIIGPVLAVLTLGLINTTVWSSQLFFNLPSDVSSQTLILLLINGVIFWIVVKILPGIETDGILPSLVAPIVFTLCALAVPRLVERVDWRVVFNQATQVVGQVKSYVDSPKSQASSSDEGE
jgi:uncharacterized membrane protein YvlD (DUF360 family)